ncbi:MAG: FmdB family zinc ribbon protein [Anaerolineae bacterium]
MPLYGYECESCHCEFERYQSFSDDPIKVCPTCGQPSARRLISSVGVIFKGSGFYVTDNRKSVSSNGRSSTKTSAASKPEKTDSTTT